jgi:hypothetical protein
MAIKLEGEGYIAHGYQEGEGCIAHEGEGYMLCRKEEGCCCQ